MEQSKKESLIEAVVNVSSGMVLAFLVIQFILVPLLDVTLPPSENVIMTIVLTIVSMARGYLWRRFFATGLHKVVHKLLRGK